MSPDTQRIIIALACKIDEIKSRMDRLSDGIEWRLAKAELEEYLALLNKIANAGEFAI